MDDDEIESTPIPAGAELPVVPKCKYEYLDHTADVQLHAKGEDLKEAFEQVTVAMFGYMTTNIDSVEMKETIELTAQADDMEGLLFQYLNEWLFYFSTEPFFIARVVEILEFDREQFRIRARGWGEPFEIGKHPQGTEVKAITYSNMQIHELESHAELFVIIDI